MQYPSDDKLAGGRTAHDRLSRELRPAAATIGVDISSGPDWTAYAHAKHGDDGSVTIERVLTVVPKSP